MDSKKKADKKAAMEKFFEEDFALDFVRFSGETSRIVATCILSACEDFGTTKKKEENAIESIRKMCGVLIHNTELNAVLADHCGGNEPELYCVPVAAHIDEVVKGCKKVLKRKCAVRAEKIDKSLCIDASFRTLNFMLVGAVRALKMGGAKEITYSCTAKPKSVTISVSADSFDPREVKDALMSGVGMIERFYPEIFEVLAEKLGGKFAAKKNALCFTLPRCEYDEKRVYVSPQQVAQHVMYAPYNMILRDIV